MDMNVLQLSGKVKKGILHRFKTLKIIKYEETQPTIRLCLLVERACHIARDAGYARINVISAIGTREYYRHLGFYDHGLYLQKEL